MNYEPKTKQFRIQNNSGASLLFVLAAMFLLLSIGGSVLVAAGAGRGAMTRQAEHNQLMLLDESVQKNIMHSLQNTNEENSLGAQIVWAVFETGGELGNIELDMNFGGDFDVDEINTIRLNIIQQDVKLGEENPQIFTERFQVDANGEWILDTNGLPISTGEWEVTQRIPRTAIVSVRLIVEVEITIGDRTMVSEAEYLFTGQGEGLTDADPNHPICTPSCRLNCPGNFSEMRLNNGGGQWTLERRGVMIHGIDEPNT